MLEQQLDDVEMLCEVEQLDGEKMRQLRKTEHPKWRLEQLQLLIQQLCGDGLELVHFEEQ